MRASIFLTLASTLATVLAQNFSSTSVTEQSANFNLVIQSANKTLNGKVLGACHDGAATEGLCLTGSTAGTKDNYVNFQFNTTREICTETNTTGTYTIPCPGDPIDPARQTGLITWWLQYNVDERVSQSMSLVFFPWSNVAMTQIGFGAYDGYNTYAAFDKKGLLNLLQYQDDTLEPGNEYLPVPRALYKWYICNTYWTGYTYVTLTWVLGSSKPQNPTCQKVNIKRVFT